MQKKQLLVLPFASTALIEGPVLRTDGGDLKLSMTFDDEGRARAVELRFLKTRAFRHLAEIYCTPWHVTDTFDTVCEVEGSEWVKELRAASTPRWRDRWVMRHFMIYVDSFASLEVVGESVQLIGSGA